MTYHIIWVVMLLCFSVIKTETGVIYWCLWCRRMERIHLTWWRFCQSCRGARGRSCGTDCWSYCSTPSLLTLQSAGSLEPRRILGTWRWRFLKSRWTWTEAFLLRGRTFGLEGPSWNIKYCFLFFPDAGHGHNRGCHYCFYSVYRYFTGKWHLHLSSWCCPDAQL